MLTFIEVHVNFNQRLLTMRNNLNVNVEFVFSIDIS